jgi:hypothetical protein
MGLVTIKFKEDINKLSNLTEFNVTIKDILDLKIYNADNTEYKDFTWDFVDLTSKNLKL